MVSNMLFAILFALLAKTNSQTDISPCPRLFVYEGKSPEPNRWYGIITLLSDNDLNGVWLRVMFDQPTLQLGNWFGEPVPQGDDKKEYLIKNRDFKLKAHTPHTVRFYVEYESRRSIPRLVSFRLNAKVMCPEEYVMEVTTREPQLLTSNPLSGNVPIEDKHGKEEVFPGDFGFINQPKRVDFECGLVVMQPRPLITYGSDTQEGEFPWHVALYYAKGIDLKYICGGSLISKDYVITVAHCVTRRRSDVPLNNDNLTVYLGKHYLKKFSSVGVQDREVSRIIIHPKYDPLTYSNDLGLLKLDTGAEVTDYVRPVCLWSGANDLSAIVNELGTVVGWGFDETGTVTETLMQAKMPVVSYETCIYSFPDFYSRFSSQNTYCAGFRNGTSVCNGDSGGGMVFRKRIGGKEVFN
ncbi:hypothetical protein FQR65_LT00203 [Abscondita terminalis]|nr:hypothetical protein FQR65_LT00203 [Abscondita terminalis]